MEFLRCSCSAAMPKRCPARPPHTVVGLGRQSGGIVGVGFGMGANFFFGAIAGFTACLCR